MSARLKTFVISVAILLAGVGGFMILKATKPVPPEKEAARDPSHCSGDGNEDR